MEKMVDITMDGDWFATVLVTLSGLRGPLPCQSDFVAQAQADLAAAGYPLDNEATYVVRDREPGEQPRYAN
jgi:hypothetical protein